MFKTIKNTLKKFESQPREKTVNFAGQDVRIKTWDKSIPKTDKFLYDHQEELQDIFSKLDWLQDEQIKINLYDKTPFGTTSYPGKDTSAGITYFVYDDKNLDEFIGSNYRKSSGQLWETSVHVHTDKTYALVHELGHVVDSAGYKDKYGSYIPDSHGRILYKSEYPDFDFIKEKFSEEVDRLVQKEEQEHGTKINRKTIEYWKDPSEIFAVGFDINYKTMFTNKLLTTPDYHHLRLPDIAMAKVFDKYTAECQKYYDEACPELAEKWNNSPLRQNNISCRFDTEYGLPARDPKEPMYYVYTDDDTGAEYWFDRLQDEHAIADYMVEQRQEYYKNLRHQENAAKQRQEAGWNPTMTREDFSGMQAAAMTADDFAGLTTGDYEL